MSRLALLSLCATVLTACGGAAPGRDPVRFRSANVTIVETRVPRQITFEQFARNEPKMLRLASHARDVRARFVRLPSGRALRVEYLLGPKRVRQLFVKRGELMYVVTVTGGDPGELERSARLVTVAP